MSRTAFRSIEVHGAITTTPSLRPRVCRLTPYCSSPQRMESTSCTCSMQNRGGIPKPPTPSPEHLTLVTGIDRTLAAAARDSSSGRGLSCQAAALLRSLAFPSNHLAAPYTTANFLVMCFINQRLMGQLTRSVPSSQCQGRDVSRNTFGQIEMDTQRL